MNVLTTGENLEALKNAKSDHALGGLAFHLLYVTDFCNEVPAGYIWEPIGKCFYIPLEENMSSTFLTRGQKVWKRVMFILGENNLESTSRSV